MSAFLLLDTTLRLQGISYSCHCIFVGWPTHDKLIKWCEQSAIAYDWTSHQPRLPSCDSPVLLSLRSEPKKKFTSQLTLVSFLSVSHPTDNHAQTEHIFVREYIYYSTTSTLHCQTCWCWVEEWPNIGRLTHKARLKLLFMEHPGYTPSCFQHFSLLYK